MTVDEVRVSGRDALLLATRLLQRARRAHPRAGLWEAADVQWWWRTPRRSDDVDELFWVDEDGPVAGVLLTAWRDDAWQCDVVLVPGGPAPGVDVVWARAQDLLSSHDVRRFEVPVADDDEELKGLVAAAGLVPGERSSVSSLDPTSRTTRRPTLRSLPDGLTLVDRTIRTADPHPMRHRSGPQVAERLRECSLYDPALDLAVEAVDGTVAAYALFWHDPVTEVGLIEPVRVEEEYWRRGIARAMLAEGIDRLADRGARDVKIGFGTDAAERLYRGMGFGSVSTATWWERV